MAVEILDPQWPRGIEQVPEVDALSKLYDEERCRRYHSYRKRLCSTQESDDTALVER